MRNSFAFYRSFMDAIEEIPDQIQKAKAYKVIVEYGLNGVEPDTSQDIIIKVLFKQAKPQIDTNNRRYDACVENGKKGAEFGKLGGAPKGNQNAKKKQPLNNPNNNPKDNPKNNPLNVNVNDNVNVNERVNSLCFFLSHTYKQFKINVDKSELANIDIDKLKERLKNSTYLQRANMRFILNNYQNVLNGKYDDFASKEQPQNQNYTNREYSSEQLNALYDNLEDVEL